MRGKLILLFVVCLFCLHASAQASAVWISFTGAPGATCDVPAANKTVLCVVNGTDLQVSANGSALVSLKGKDGVNGTNGTNGKDGAVGATGATGAVGPQGAKGDTGATGAQGPSGAVTINNKVCSLKFTGAATADGGVAVSLTCP